nr:hypothetical protein CFP56_73617 [Quercus suber]
MEPEATVYSEWMVVTRRKKPNRNGRTYSKGCVMGDAWGQDVPSQPRDPQAIPRDIDPDNQKDMKRKAFVPNVGKDELHEGASQGKAFVGKSTIVGIQRDPTKIMGWYNAEEMEAWKNIFPLKEVSAHLGYLPLTEEAWLTTPKAYWHFLIDQPKFPPLISHQQGHLF